MKHQTRITLAGSLGNLIESFDTTLCELLSVFIAIYLIGSSSQDLFIVFLTFFAGYLARPIGAITMGLLSDIYGRKKVLACSILTMGISTTLIAFIPSHSVIGKLAMVMLFLLRIVQSFACGAEYLNSWAFLIENADVSKKGSTGSWASFGTMSGMLIASMLALVIYHYANVYPEYEWFIWRIPFVLALLGSSIGLYIRLCIPESMEYIMYYVDKPKPNFNNLVSQSVSYIKTNKMQSLYAFVLSCLGVTTTYQIFIYGPMQAHIYGNLGDQQIITSNIISLIVLLGVFPLLVNYLIKLTL